MATRRLRVEFIRFGLLLTMTVALISVATRYHDNGSSRSEAARGHGPAASSTPSPASGGASTPAETPSTPASSPAAGGSDTSSGAGSSEPTAGDASGTSQPGQVTAVPTLPRTGGTQAVQLAALAALFIAAGGFGMRISRPRPLGQTGEPTATATQPGQASGSSVSNLPGTV